MDHDDVFDALAMQYGLARRCQYESLEEYEREDHEREDDEPGWSGVVSTTLYDRWGNPVTLTADTSRVQPERFIGRAGVSSQRLKVGNL